MILPAVLFLIRFPLAIQGFCNRLANPSTRLIRQDQSNSQMIRTTTRPVTKLDLPYITVQVFKARDRYRHHC
ncbi:hypothetical protein V8C35DRAFT_303171, partial [Trichoderma chlorosporum]